jgi:hypothetical protein
LVLGLALLVGGCARMQQNICSPTADQVAAYSQQIADASDALEFFQAMAPSVPVLAIIAGLKLAVATLNQARDGYCADAAQLAAASDAIVNAKSTAASLQAGQRLTLAHGN